MELFDVVVTYLRHKKKQELLKFLNVFINLY